MSHTSEASVPERLTYAPVSECDFDELASLRIAAMRESLERVGRFDPARARQRLADSFYPSDTWMILWDGNHVGFYTMRSNGDEFHLDHLYIHPDSQSLGIGSRVLGRLIETANQSGRTIRLNALRESRSNVFYQRHGFTQTDEDALDIYYVWRPTLKHDPKDFLGSCDVIDTSSPRIVACAERLAGSNELTTAKSCFEFVRDRIKHSSDHKLNPVTCRASDVLEHHNGYCYAKSHLLCALLRANGIPAGLSYQRLSIDGNGSPFCLHGLNTIYLSEYSWYRIDARGNRPDVNAQFAPPIEQLAFPVRLHGEKDLPTIWQRPHPAVTECLSKYDDWSDVYEHLPDAN